MPKLLIIVHQLLFQLRNALTSSLAQPAARQSAKIIAALPKAAAAYRRQIKLGLENNPRDANKARVILRDLLGPILMCPEPDGSLWAEFYARPAALVKKAVGTGVGSDGSGGVMNVALRADVCRLTASASERPRGLTGNILLPALRAN